MDVSVRDLRNHTARIVAAVESGERVTLLNRGTPVADIVPHVQRARWLPGAWVREQLADLQADPGLTDVLKRDLGQTIDEL